MIFSLTPISSSLFRKQLLDLNITPDKLLRPAPLYFEVDHYRACVNGLYLCVIERSKTETKQAFCKHVIRRMTETLESCFFTRNSPFLTFDAPICFHHQWNRADNYLPI